MITLKNILQILVSQDSTQYNELAIANFLQDHLVGLGLQVEKIKLSNHRFNIYAYRHQERTDVIWYGHIDTVPVYDGWRTNPFQIEEVDDRYYGLGVCDMKGGIAALLSAVSKIDKNQPVRILFCADEEYDSEGAWEVNNKYPGIFKDIRYLISMEPGASTMKVGGADVLTLGRRGRIRMKVKIRGVSAHGAHPNRGVNAIDLANGFMSDMQQMELPVHPQLGEATHFVASHISTAQGLSLPEYAELEIDRHLVVPDTVLSALEQYQTLANDYEEKVKKQLPPGLCERIKITVELKERKNPYIPPFITEENDTFIRQIQSFMEKQNSDITINYGKSVGDENVFAQMGDISIAIIGPEGGDIHAPNEWVSKDSLLQCEELYLDILNR